MIFYKNQYVIIVSLFTDFAPFENPFHSKKQKNALKKNFCPKTCQNFTISEGFLPSFPSPLPFSL